MNNSIEVLKITEAIESALINAGMPNCEISISEAQGITGQYVLSINAIKYKFPLQKWLINEKNYVAEPQAVRLIEKIENKKTLVYAEKIEPKAKAILRSNEISYLDSTSDLYLNGDGFLIFLSNAKRKSLETKSAKPIYSKAWTKLLLLLLTNPTATNWNQRQIANGAKLGLGTVSQILKAERKRIKELAALPISKDYEVVSELLERWAEIFLKNGIGQKLLGTFEMPSISTIGLYSECAWSGEIASHLYSDRLEDRLWNSAGLIPTNGILYTNKSIYEIMRFMKLIPNPNGALKIFDMPWDDQLNNEGIAPFPVIYADLLKGDSRSIKEAQKIETIYLTSFI